MTKASGRPRDEALTAAILEKARQLVIEKGYDEVTTELIARETRSSKQAIYRRWPTKQDLVLDALLVHAVARVDRNLEPWPGLEAALQGFVQRLFKAVRPTSTVVRALMAEAQRDEIFRERFTNRLIKPRQAALRRLLSQAVEHGELKPTAPIEHAIELIYGAFWYQLMLDRNQSPKHTTIFAQMIARSLLSSE